MRASGTMPACSLAYFRATVDTYAVRFILNVIWLILAGFWLAIGYVLAGIVACILIITIPFGIAAFRIAAYALWPFGRTVVRRADAGAGSTIGNILWLVAVRVVANARAPDHRDRAVHHDHRDPAWPGQLQDDSGVSYPAGPGDRVQTTVGARH